MSRSIRPEKPKNLSLPSAEVLEALSKETEVIPCPRCKRASQPKAPGDLGHDRYCRICQLSFKLKTKKIQGAL